MWEGICRRNGHLSLNFQLDRSHNQDQDSGSSVHLRAARRKNAEFWAFSFCWDWRCWRLYGFYFRHQGTRQMYRQPQLFCSELTWSEHQFGSQGGCTRCEVWALNRSSGLGPASTRPARRVQKSLAWSALVQAHKPTSVSKPLPSWDHGIQNGWITWERVGSLYSLRRQSFIPWEGSFVGCSVVPWGSSPKQRSGRWQGKGMGRRRSITWHLLIDSLC